LKTVGPNPNEENSDRRTMYPVTGASGGATRSPHLKIPTMLASRDPCHSNILTQ